MKISLIGSFFCIMGSLAAFSLEFEEEEELAIAEEEKAKEDKKNIIAEVEPTFYMDVEEDDDDPCEEYPYCIGPYRVYLSHIEGKGIGYKTGYSSLGVFLGFGELADSSVSTFEPFIDIRTHFLNNGHFAANVGGGLRQINYCEYIWGLNAYYDWRHGKHGNFQQFGLGFEVMREHLSFRANVYLPTGKKVRSSKPHLFTGYDGGYTVTCKKQERAGKGVDGEFGFFTAGFCEGFSFYLGLGPYFFKRHGREVEKHDGKVGRHNNRDVVGGMGRIILQGWEYVGLEGRIFYDRVDKCIGQVKLSLSFPFARREREQILRRSQGCCCEDVIQFKELAIQPVLRNEIIFLENYLHCRTN